MNIKCLFGFHKWKEIDDITIFAVHPVWIKKCMICNKIKDK